MKFRNTIIAFIFLCLAIGALYYVFNKKAKKAAAEKKENQLVKVNSDEIVFLELSNKHGVFVFEKLKEDKDWKITKPILAEVDEASFKTLLDNLSELNETRSFKVEKKELPDYGLAPAELFLEIKTTQGEKETFSFGIKNPGETMQYAMIDNSLNLKLVDPTLYDFRNKKLKDLRNKNLFKFNSDDVTKIVAVYHPNNQKFIIEKKDSDYYLVEPLKTKADKLAMNRFITSILSIKAKEFPTEDYTEAIAKYGFDKPYAEITVVLNDGSEEKLYIGKESKNKNLYVRNNKAKFVIETKGKAKNDLSPSLAGLINKRISDDWNKDDVEKLKIRAGKKAKTIEKIDGLWVLSNLQDLADQGKINNLLQRLKGVVAEEFVSVEPKKDHSLNSPHLTVELIDAADNSLSTYKFGKYYPVNKMYVLGGSSDFVYTIASTVPEHIKKEFNDLRNKKLSILKRFKINEIKYSDSLGAVLFKKDENDKWSTQLSGSIKYSNQEDTIKKDVARILDFFFQNKISGYVDTYDAKNSKKQFGFDEPSTTLSLSENKGNADTIIIGKKNPVGEIVYAKNLSRDNVYKINVKDLDQIKSIFNGKNNKEEANE